MRERLKHVAAELRKPQIWARLGKTGVVLSVEMALAPVALVVAALTPGGRGAERLLSFQNRLRRRGLRWIFPEFRPPR